MGGLCSGKSDNPAFIEPIKNQRLATANGNMPTNEYTPETKNPYAIVDTKALEDQNLHGGSNGKLQIDNSKVKQFTVKSRPESQQQQPSNLQDRNDQGITSHDESIPAAKQEPEKKQVDDEDTKLAAAAAEAQV